VLYVRRGGVHSLNGSSNVHQLALPSQLIAKAAGYAFCSLRICSNQFYGKAWRKPGRGADCQLLNAAVPQLRYHPSTPS
jgi:hypothetical protein